MHGDAGTLIIDKILLFAVAALCAAPAHAVQPTVTSSFSPALDSACALVRGGEIRDE